MTTPLVSVTSAFYNTGTLLLDMVRGIFGQTFDDWELVLLDDGSTDNSLELAQSIDDPRVRVFSNGRNRGIPASLNRLTELARGKYIARQDADDMSAATRIQRQVEFMEKNPGVDVVGCGMVCLDEHDEPLGERLAKPTHEEICRAPDRYYGMIHPTIFAEHGWFKNNRYDESLAKSEDRNLFVRTTETSRYANIPDPLFFYRLGASFSFRKLLIHRQCVARFMFERYASQRRYGKAILNWARPYVRTAGGLVVCTLCGRKRFLARRYAKITDEQRTAYRAAVREIKEIELPLRRSSAG